MSRGMDKRIEGALGGSLFKYFSIIIDHNVIGPLVNKVMLKLTQYIASKRSNHEKLLFVHRTNPKRNIAIQVVWASFVLFAIVRQLL